MREVLAHRGDPYVERIRGRFEQALAEVGQYVGRIEVTGGVPGAEVVIQGSSAGRLPLAQPVTVLVGVVALEVRAPGYATLRRSVNVSAGAVVRESVTLVASAESPALGAAAPLSGVRPAGSALPTVGVVGVAVGGAVLVGSAVAWVLRESAAVQYNDDTRCNRDARSRDLECPGERSNVETLTTLTGVGLGVGAALGVAGAVLLLTAPRGTEGLSTQRVHVGLGPGTAGVTVVATF
jgi:hypothetical protein